VYTENKFGFNFCDNPEHIFNCDESGIEFDAVSKIIYTEKGRNLNCINAVRKLKRKLCLLIPKFR